MPTPLPAPDLAATVSGTANPLVASVSLVLPAGASAHVEYGLRAPFQMRTSEVAAPTNGGTIEILVAGLLPNQEYSLQPVVQYADGWTFTGAVLPFQSGPLPTNITLPTLVVTTPTPGLTPSPGVELMNIIQPDMISVVADVQGHVIWFYDNAQDASWSGYAFPIKFLPNGHLLASISNMYTQPYKKKQPNAVLREIDLAGNTIVTSSGTRELDLASLNTQLQKVPTSTGRVVTAYCYSHDFLTLLNGHTILIVQELHDPSSPDMTPANPMGDALVDLDENFMVVWVWSAFDWLSTSRWPPPFRPPNAGNDWTHCNAVIATPDGNLILSVRNQSWVLKINYQNGLGDGSLLWTLGHEGSFNWTSGTADWFSAQHFPRIIAVDGDKITELGMFDNGNVRAATKDLYSRGAIFNIDEVNLTASLTWQWVPSQYSFWGGNVVPPAADRMEIAMSEPCAVNTIPPAKDLPSVVTEVTMDSPPQIVWQMQSSPGAVYRSYRIPSLYPGVIW